MATTSMPSGSIILVWNNIYLDVVRHIGGAPGPLAHIGGRMHLAMYEAINQLTGNTYPNALAPVPVTGSPDPTSSAAYAACFTLTDAVAQYIEQAKRMQGGALNPFDPFQVLAGAQTHAQALINSGPTPVDTASEKYGRAIADAVIAKFPADAGLGPVVTPRLDPEKEGEWRDTGSGPALTPQWGMIPLLLLNSRQHPIKSYLPKTIPSSLLNYKDLLASTLYADQVNEVKNKGAAHHSTRKEEETEIAFFWANDLNGTSKPPGQLYTITQDVAKQQGILQGVNGLLETARLFAMVGTAMVNASVVAWYAKYFHPDTKGPLRLWRPETAIQRATDDGNPGTAADPAWQPLSAMINGTRFSPNFPAYVSGHACFGAAHAAAMQAFFGTDTIPFTATTEDPHALRDENGIRRTRSFLSFKKAALENGRSRVYLGVHYQFDAVGGYEIGTAVGQDTAAFFQPQPPTNRAFLTRASGGIQSVFLDNPGSDVAFDLTVSTKCVWSFTLSSTPSPIQEKQDSLNSASRRTGPVGKPEDLIGKNHSWSLHLINEDTQNPLDYTVEFYLLQDGKSVYEYKQTGKIDTTTPDAILGETLSYRS
ncbi:vanadium-dependent haloperoxidase [Hymenobacter lucidus]|uniref:Vanadium-dependent haloperoxidase n=1 Tax=Hymenobacter lucidus TaxID=2880930 RepID=A0ABS8AVM4_9BACT|nr:vanadium-dependent haloperoxidase [Hymenobacter lucidus]MCB2409232.1 vanadium-dependent haloperoxidase [Hymenobacter lucidus]